MAFGLKDGDIKKINMVFEKYSGLEKAVLYGSRARGNYHKGSDIDLVLFGNNLNFTMQLSIESELDDLLLPYKIDLSLFHKIDNPALLEHIDRVGKLFYQRALV